MISRALGTGIIDRLAGRTDAEETIDTVGLPRTRVGIDAGCIGSVAYSAWADVVFITCIGCTRAGIITIGSFDAEGVVGARSGVATGLVGEVADSTLACQLTAEGGFVNTLLAGADKAIQAVAGLACVCADLGIDAFTVSVANPLFAADVSTYVLNTRT